MAVVQLRKPKFLLTTLISAWNHWMGFPKGGEHPLCEILISAGVNTPAAKWLRLFASDAEALAAQTVE
jgi:hypothetical protein